MTYEKMFEALGDGTRRSVFEQLRAGPMDVVHLAQHVPVSRPAVSQHLKALLEAGLVEATPQGARRVYSVRVEAMQELRDWLDGFWDANLAAFKAAAESGEEGEK